MRRNVIVIPSWLSLDGVKGSFFREQAEVMYENFDMRFLYGEEIRLNLLSAIGFIFKGKNIFKHEKFENINTYYFFNYPSFNFFPPTLNLKIKKRFYKQQLLIIKEHYAFWPQLIHAQSTFDGGVISFYLSLVFRIPFILTEHNLFLLHDIDEKKRKDGIRALENASKVLVVSHDKARQILMHNIKVKPIVIGNLVDERFFYYQPRKKKEEYIIMFVGHFSYIKDFDTFFEAMKILNTVSNLNFRIKCVGYNIWGDTDNTNAVKSLAENYGITNISFDGTIERSKMNRLYWDSDLLVLTSIAEGLPVCVLESLACGRPVFATRCGGVEDVVDIDSGRIVPIMEPVMLASEIVRFFRNEIKFDNEKISQRVISKYASRIFSANLKEIYCEAIEGKEAK